MRYRFFYICLGVLMLLAGCSGCLLSVSSHTVQSGTFVPYRVTDQIVIGETPRQWVIDTLGEPSCVEQREDGTEILRYVSTRRKSDAVEVLILLDICGSKTTEYQLSIEIRDGVVQDYHRQSSRADKRFNLG